MKVAVASDHRGYEAKEQIKAIITQLGHETVDFGTTDSNPVDYPDLAFEAASAISNQQVDRAILICGTGIGMCIAANKVPGVRACLCHDTYSAHQGVEHDDMNILCLGARVVGPELAEELAMAFLEAKFSGEARHRRRLEKVLAIEQQALQSDRQGNKGG